MSRRKPTKFDNEGYSVTVTGRHMQVTDPMKDYAVEKISKLERLGSRIVDVDVIMDIQRINHTVEIIMKYGNMIATAKAVTTDMYASIDQAIHKLNTRIKKYRDRMMDHYAKRTSPRELPETVYMSEPEILDEDEANSEIEEENEARLEKALRPHEIVRQDTQQLNILTDNEALMNMELSRKPLIVFRDEATQGLKVIYKREDGNFGVIKVE